MPKVVFCFLLSASWLLCTGQDYEPFIGRLSLLEEQLTTDYEFERKLHIEYYPVKAKGIKQITLVSYPVSYITKLADSFDAKRINYSFDRDGKLMSYHSEYVFEERFVTGDSLFIIYQNDSQKITLVTKTDSTEWVFDNKRLPVSQRKYMNEHSLSEKELLYNERGFDVFESSLFFKKYKAESHYYNSSGSVVKTIYHPLEGFPVNLPVLYYTYDSAGRLTSSLTLLKSSESPEEERTQSLAQEYDTTIAHYYTYKGGKLNKELKFEKRHTKEEKKYTYGEHSLPIKISLSNPDLQVFFENSRDWTEFQYQFNHFSDPITIEQYEPERYSLSENKTIFLTRKTVISYQYW